MFFLKSIDQHLKQIYLLRFYLPQNSCFWLHKLFLDFNKNNCFFQILFEHLSVPAMYLADQLSLALYSSGLTTGVSVSSGFSVTESAVVYEGHMLPHTAQQLDIAGQQLTENFRLLLRDNKGLNFVSSSEWQLVNTMKETLAYVAQGLSAILKMLNTIQSYLI